MGKHGPTSHDTGPKLCDKGPISRDIGPILRDSGPKSRDTGPIPLRPKKEVTET